MSSEIRFVGLGGTDPFWTAPFALISTMSPTLRRISIQFTPNAHLINLLVLAQVGRQLDHTLLPELHKKLALVSEKEVRETYISTKRIAGSRSETCWMTHDVGRVWLSMGALEIVSRC
jgi:hypothetical protein